MQTQKNTVSPPLNHIPRLSPRALAYWITASVILYSLANQHLSSIFLAVVAYLSVFPWLSKMVINAVFRNQQQDSATGKRGLSILFCDSLNIGVLISLTDFPMVGSMLLVILLAGWAIYLQGPKGLMIIIPSAVAALLIDYFIDLSIPISAGKDATFISLLGMLIFTAYLAYVLRCREQHFQAIQLNAQQQRQRYSRLASNLAKYLSPQVWESIFAGKRNAKLESQRKKLTVFFSDIKGFTDLAEELEPEVLTELLNTYLNDMSRIALKYGGTIDKFIGDSIMIFFGDPKTRGYRKDALAAVSMAIEMQKHMQVLRKQWIAKGIENPLRIRIGINTGYCTVGNFGAESRMDYTLLGREVNLASRLESAAEPNQILLSNETWSLVKDVVLCQSKGEIQVKGFSRSVPIYKVIDLRRNLGLQKSYFEHDSKGFSFSLDTNSIDEFERRKIIQTLDEATQKLLKDDISSPTKPARHSISQTPSEQLQNKTVA
ncbi:adenylate/guanylate cyclase domain-containing protein [Endozoicomonas elysicola]|uniref:adenylate/guanylate cyclase domain-containing protein n=1 Tax=Endozoicomonas elysicola TaxID=305900 RepID=UPI000377B6F5|nr:adenylate/guanylate cyclase domain-containing protein [Endozoicomonas elysicola]